MKRELITDKEAICFLSIFIMGSTLILGIGGDAKNDAWIVAITGVIVSIPMLMVYAKLLSLFPEKGLYEILEIIFGKIISKIISVLYIWYSFHLGALVIRNFGEFINTVTMPETPMIVPMLCLGIVCIVAVKAGIEVMARVSAFVLPYLLLIMALVQLLGISSLNFEFIKPVLANGLKPILKGTFSIFTFPFAESVLFLEVLFNLKNKQSFKKVYLTSLFLAGGIILILTLRNIFILGSLMGKLYFPAHIAVSRVNIGDFLERIEVTVAIVFVFGVFVKASVCLFVACKGITKLFNLRDYGSITIQMGLLMIYLAYIVYDDIMEMQKWAFSTYAYYAFPFQAIIPVLMLILAKIKLRRN